MKNTMNKEEVLMKAHSIEQAIKEDLWNTGQALKVLAYYDLSRTDINAFIKAVKYQPFPRSADKKRA